MGVYMFFHVLVVVIISYGKGKSRSDSRCLTDGGWRLHTPNNLLPTLLPCTRWLNVSPLSMCMLDSFPIIHHVWPFVLSVYYIMWCVGVPSFCHVSIDCPDVVWLCGVMCRRRSSPWPMWGGTGAGGPSMPRYSVRRFTCHIYIYNVYIMYIYRERDLITYRSSMPLYSVRHFTCHIIYIMYI
jgi:hypothetical protein